MTKALINAGRRNVFRRHQQIVLDETPPGDESMIGAFFPFALIGHVTLAATFWRHSCPRCKQHGYLNRKVTALSGAQPSEYVFRAGCATAKCPHYIANQEWSDDAKAVTNCWKMKAAMG